MQGLKLAIKSSFLGSRSEKELYDNLSANWTLKGVELYPSLPFSEIIDLEKIELTSEQKDFLYKISVDYRAREYI